LLEKLAVWLESVPVIVAHCGYGRSVSFHLALESGGLSYVMAVEPKEIAQPAAAEPYLPTYRGWVRPRCPTAASRPALCETWLPTLPTCGM
jgi:hypothetical protein